MLRVRPLTALCVFALSGIAISAQQSLPPQAADRRPDVLVPQRHDRTPALRDMRLIAPEDEKEDTPHAPLPVHGGRRILGERRDAALQTAPAAGSAITPRASFEGIGNTAGVLPPDTNGDVGPNHYIQWVNLSFAIFRKSDGAVLYGPANGKTLWQGFGGPCETRNDGDPIVLYDEISDRWLMSQFALPNYPQGPYYQCIAVSTSGDPTGTWNRYAYSFSKLNDYPKFGVWPDGYYMTMNQFTCNIVGQCSWAGQGVVAFERTQMLSGGAARAIYFDMVSDASLGGMLPADLDGATLPPNGAPAYYAQFDDQPDQLQLWQFKADWNNVGNSTFTRKALLATSAFDSNMCNYARACIPQSGTAAKLDAISDRLMYRLQYRNFGDHESLVTNHTVDVGADRGGVRWYEVRNPSTSPVIYQQGTFAPSDTLNRWMGSGAMDASGNLAIGYSVSNTSTFPSIRFSGRFANDPLGTLTVAESDLRVGTGSQTSSTSRWGDYSMLSVDPTDGCTFWYTTEYYSGTSSAGWRTNIGSFQIGNCGTPPPPPPPTPPAAPTNLTLFPGATSIHMSWSDNSSDETGFSLERCAGAGCSNFAVVATLPANSVTYTDDGLQGSTSYSYRVRAVNANNGLSSAYSNTATGTTTGAPTPPAAPSGLTASAQSSSSIALNWTDNSSDETSFSVERCAGAGCTNFAPVASTAANTPAFTDTGLQASTSYSYRVRAVNATNGTSSTYSNTASATTSGSGPTPPAAPSGLNASAQSSSSIALSWTDNSSDETSFSVERCTGAGCTNFAPVGSSGANTPAFTDTGLQPSTTYTYRVQAVNANTGLSSTYSNTASATTSGNPPPAGTMWVTAMNPSSSTNGRNGWKGTVTITVSNGSGPVANATVSAAWSNGYSGSASCVTGSSGSCSVTTGRISTSVPSATLTVTNVTHATLTYDASKNVVSSATVVKP